MLDVMMGTKVWGEKYISNPFSYIQEDLSKISASDF